MFSKTAALPHPESKQERADEPRRVSPEVAEILHLIGAMERLVDDVEVRRKTAD